MITRYQATLQLQYIKKLLKQRQILIYQQSIIDNYKDKCYYEQQHLQKMKFENLQYQIAEYQNRQSSYQQNIKKFHKSQVSYQEQYNFKKHTLKQNGNRTPRQSRQNPQIRFSYLSKENDLPHISYTKKSAHNHNANPNKTHQNHIYPIKKQQTETNKELKPTVKQGVSIQIQTDPTQQKQIIIVIKVAANRYQKYFCGDVLFNDEYQKQYLTQTIQRLFGRIVKNTRLLFRYDKNNSTNIHKYIDGHEYFILLAKLNNQYLIAFISQGSLDEKNMKNKNGWLVSLTNHKQYPVLHDKKTLTYEQKYFIAGNSEIRVSSHSTKLLSNFGISNNYFDTKEDSVNDFIGNGDQRQIQFEYLQVFKILFE